MKKLKKSSIIKIVIVIAIMLFAVSTIVDFVRGFREPVVIVEGNELIIQSSYGVTIAKNEIYSLKLVDEMPTLTRGNGFGFGNTQKGQVKISNLGEGLAYIRVENPPYIYIQLGAIDKENYVFLNLHDADDTRELYESIQAWYEDTQE
jgi:hypothetical protein